MPSSRASELTHFMHTVPNYPPGLSNAIISLCGVGTPVQLRREASEVTCHLCREKLDMSMSIRLTKVMR